MSHQLTVHALPSPVRETDREVTIRVFWRVGERCRNALDVRLPGICGDPLSAAEIVALRHLLGVREVMGRNRNGSGLVLVCSRGAVKKVARRTSSKAGLWAYSEPLTTRYVGAEYVVSKDRDWLPPEGARVAIAVVDALADASGAEVHAIAGLGPVAVTHHALESYVECVDPLGKSPWRSLVRHLGGGLRRVDLPPGVLRHKLRKYGEAGVPEIWKHPDNPLHFVLLPSGGVLRLLTVFELRD
jgi:hypothetical protein